MQTLTLEIKDHNAINTLRALEKKGTIKIIDDIEVNSPSLAGEPISIKAFKKWIANSENDKSISLVEAKERWKEKKIQLEKIIQ